MAVNGFVISGKAGRFRMEIRKSEIANEVARLCKERGITQYELANAPSCRKVPSGTCFRKARLLLTAPLSAICGGLGITVPQFFTASSFLEKLPPEEKELMTIYLKLDEKDRSRLLSYARRTSSKTKKKLPCEGRQSLLY